MKYIFLIVGTFFLLNSIDNAFAWGKNGHRIVGEIAESHLNQKARLGVKKLLDGDSLARVSTWADEIRSNPSYQYSAPWHYVSIPNDKNYFDQKRNPNGDLLIALFQFEETLKDPKKTKSEKAEALKFLVHMMGDLHQPLHVGLADDRGGNAVLVKWFKKDTNLHALWDEDIINFEELSYTEYAKILNRFTKKEKEKYSKGHYLDWAAESQSIRSGLYPGESKQLGYEYHYKVKPIYEERLKQAGYRLAMVINKIFEGKKDTKELLELKNKMRSNI